MKTSERVFLYAAVVGLLAVNGVLLLSNTGRQAFAEAAAWLQDLGPAQSLTLVDGEKQLTLRNANGQLAWGNGDFAKAHSVAFVDIGKALNPLMESSAFVEEREALRSELEGVEKDFQDRLNAYGEQIEAMDRESPEAQQRIEEARGVYQEYMQWGQEAVNRRNTLDVAHLQKAYRELQNAVEVVADRLGVDIVLRFIPAEQEFKAQDAEQAMTEIRLRSAVKYPSGLDITSEVLRELSLQETD